MNTKLIIVIVAALIAVAYSQCLNLKCAGENKPCGVDTNDVIGCNSGLECSGANTTSSVCNKRPGLHQSCSTINCREGNYAVTCSSGTCLYVPALGPGEDCSKVTAADYISSGACVQGTCTGGVCSGNVSSTGSCDLTTNFCAKGTWCNAGTCTATAASGVACSQTFECGWSQICSGFGSTTGTTCGTPFNVAAGGACSSVVECNTGLGCFGGKCTQPSDEGKSCTVPATPGQGDCPSADYSCECNGNFGSSGTCVSSTISGKEKSALNSYTSCMNTNCKYDLSALEVLSVAHTQVVVGLTPDSCAQQKCGGAVSGLVGALGGGGCGAASSVQILVAMIVSLVAIVLMF